MTFFGEQPAWLVAADVGFATMLVLIFGPLGLPGRIKFFYKARVPEADWRHAYSHQSLEEFIRKVTEPGVRRFRRALAWDILFAVLFSASLAFLIDALLARSLDSDQGIFRWAVWMPALYAIFDIAEDLALRLVTNNKNLTWDGENPDFRAGDGLVRAARVFTRLKFVFVVLSLLCVAAGAVSLTLLGPGS